MPGGPGIAWLASARAAPSPPTRQPASPPARQVMSSYAVARLRSHPRSSAIPTEPKITAAVAS